MSNFEIIFQPRRPNKKQQEFEAFLRDKHMKLHPRLLDDDLPDHFDNWFGSLSKEELIALEKEHEEIKKKNSSRKT